MRGAILHCSTIFPAYSFIWNYAGVQSTTLFASLLPVTGWQQGLSMPYRIRIFEALSANEATAESVRDKWAPKREQ